MNTKLSEGNCIPCEGEIKPLQGKKLEVMLAKLGKEAPDWEYWETNGGGHLGKTFRFPDFKTALAFVDKVGAIAEAENHHPAIQLRWGWVRIITWTHAINGLSESDFILASKIDNIK